MYVAADRLNGVFLLLFVGWKVYAAAGKLNCVCLMCWNVCEITDVLEYVCGCWCVGTCLRFLVDWTVSETAGVLSEIAG